MEKGENLQRKIQAALADIADTQLDSRRVCKYDIFQSHLKFKLYFIKDHHAAISSPSLHKTQLERLSLQFSFPVS